MQSRTLRFLLAGAFVAGCAGSADEQADAPDATATAETAVSADEAALEQLSADFETHYNMHHADVVADLYADSAFVLWADGNVSMNKAEILAQLQGAMAGQPTIDLTRGETMVLGDNAVAHGTWDVTAAMEGAPEPVNMSGHYLVYFERQADQWKIQGSITNYDAPPPASLPAPAEMEPPPDEGTMTDVVNAFTAAYNAGDAAAVANLYTEDAFAAYANAAPVQGRAAIQARMAERFAAGASTIEIHDVGTIDLGNGWALDGGWYTFTATPTGGEAVTQSGTFMNLMQQQADGSWKIHWGVSNGRTPS